MQLSLFSGLNNIQYENNTNSNSFEVKSPSPPYRMPPKPPGISMLNQCDEIQIPGATTTETADFPNQTLRTHSSKFPVSTFKHSQYLLIIQYVICKC